MSEILQLQRIRSEAETALRKASDEYRAAKDLLDRLDAAIATESRKLRWNDQRLMVVSVLVLGATLLLVGIGWY